MAMETGWPVNFNRLYLEDWWRLEVAESFMNLDLFSIRGCSPSNPAWGQRFGRMCMRFGQLRGTPIMLGCKLPEQRLCNAVCWGFETIILELLRCTESHILHGCVHIMWRKFKHQQDQQVQNFHWSHCYASIYQNMFDICQLNIYIGRSRTHFATGICVHAMHYTDSPGQIQEALARAGNEPQVSIIETDFTISWQTKALHKMIHAGATSETGSSRILQTNFTQL